MGVFAPGKYELQAGTYTPGKQTPETCAKFTVDVTGDMTVQVPALGNCP